MTIAEAICKTSIFSNKLTGIGAYPSDLLPYPDLETEVPLNTHKQTYTGHQPINLFYVLCTIPRSYEVSILQSHIWHACS